MANNKGLSCTLAIEKHGLIFQFHEADSLISEATLNAGYQQIANDFFKNDIPGEAEIDHAINFIEEALMRDQALIEKTGKLFTSDLKLKAIFQKNGMGEQKYSRHQVENLFSQYARVMMGAPSSEIKAAINREDVATLLLLREVMHHLDFEELLILDGGEAPTYSKPSIND